jgi:hypothetical protein
MNCSTWSRLMSRAGSWIESIYSYPNDFITEEGMEVGRMKCAASTSPLRALVEQCRHGAMIGGVVCEFVLPMMRDDVEPGAGEITRAAGMVVPWGSGAVVQVGGPFGCIGDPPKIAQTRMVSQ